MKQTHGKDLSAFITSISIRFNALTKALAGSPVFSETLMKGVPVAIGIGKTLKLADGIGLKRTSATDYEIVANSTLWADGPRASVSFPGNTVPIFTLKERSDGLMEVSIEHSSLVDEEARITLPSSSNDKVIITRNPKGSTRMYDVRGADFYPIKYKDADEAMLALNKAISSNVVATIIHRSSSKVRGNKEVMLKALTKAPYLFRLASKELREDSKFVRTVIEKTRDVQIMYHALLSRQSMEEIIIPVIKESPLSITFVPYSVYSDTFVERIREFFTNNAHKLEFDRWKSLAEDYHKSKQ